MLHVNDYYAAQGCVDRLDEIAESIIASISEKIIQKVSRRTSNQELIPSKKEEDADKNKIGLNFGEIHEEVEPPNYDTMEIFVPYGFPTIGSYGMTAFMDGIPITDKKKNSMGKPEYGFYVTVVMSFGDFKGISDSGEPFKKIWDEKLSEKGYEEKVRVIALIDNGVLTSKTPEAFCFLVLQQARQRLRQVVQTQQGCHKCWCWCWCWCCCRRS
jgi:hypothetical protein